MQINLEIKRLKSRFCLLVQPFIVNQMYNASTIQCTQISIHTVQFVAILCLVSFADNTIDFDFDLYFVFRLDPDPWRRKLAYKLSENSTLKCMQVKGMPFWRISWIFALFAYKKLLDKCFDINNQDFVRWSVSEDFCCFYLSLHMAILFPVVMYHRTTLTLAFIYNVNMPRNIMSIAARLVMYKVYFLKIILTECYTTKTNIPITQSLFYIA